MKRAPILPLLAALALGLMPGAAHADVVGGQFRYWAFDDHDDVRNPLAYYAADHWHAQIEFWDFVKSDDQFRSEVGVHFNDKRNILYSVTWRHVPDQERLTFGVAKTLTAHIAGRAEISPIFSPTTETLIVGLVGADYYWGSYNFFSASIVRDPRDDSFWVFPMRVRLANEQNDWIQLGWAPATQKTNGWAADVKKKWLRLGIESNSRYDFTDVNNIIYTVGFELKLPDPALAYLAAAFFAGVNSRDTELMQ